MKTWTITATPPTGTLGDSLQLVTKAEKPTAVGPGQILIETQYAGVAIDDIRIAEDRFMPLVKANPSPESPFVLGHECGGTVVAVGDNVPATSFQVGDKVYGTTHGAWSEYCVLDAKVSGKVPEGWKVDQAVAYITGAAVGGAVIQHLKAEELENKIAIVVGASGSIGNAVLQWLVQHKVRVLAVCSAAKANKVKALGAEHILDYTKGPWEQQLPEDIPAVDYVLDFVGGTPIELAAKKVLKKEPHSKFITAVGPNDEPNVGVGWGGLIGMGLKMVFRQLTWKKPQWIMAVQSDPADNSSPALGTSIEPLIDQVVVNGWDKAAVKEAIDRVNSRRAAGRVLLKFK